jgi:hypothetical protein
MIEFSSGLFRLDAHVTEFIVLSGGPAKGVPLSAARLSRLRPKVTYAGLAQIRLRYLPEFGGILWARSGILLRSLSAA